MFSKLSLYSMDYTGYSMMIENNFAVNFLTGCFILISLTQFTQNDLFKTETFDVGESTTFYFNLQRVSFQPDFDFHH